MKYIRTYKIERFKSKLIRKWHNILIVIFILILTAKVGLSSVNIIFSY